MDTSLSLNGRIKIVVSTMFLIIIFLNWKTGAIVKRRLGDILGQDNLHFDFQLQYVQWHPSQFKLIKKIN